MTTHPIARSCLGLLVVLLPAFAMAQDSGFVPPTAVFFHDDFASATSVPENWQIDAGNWAAANGTYDSRSGATTATTTITEYANPLQPDNPPQSLLGPYTLRARVSIPNGGAQQLAGLVFDYEDEANFLEAVFSAAGTFELRRMRYGTSTILAQGEYSGGGPNTWFDIEIYRVIGDSPVSINGILLTTVNFDDPPRYGGRVGLTTHATTAKFDKVSIAVACCLHTQPPTTGHPQPFRNDFNAFRWAGNWTITSGDWSLNDGTLTNTSVQQTSSVLHESIGISFEPESTPAYTLRARMLNPYGASGNLVGMFFNDSPAGRGEILFSPTGVAQIRLIRNGAIQTIATKAYSGRRNVWFDVRTDVNSNRINVAVDGTTIFKDVSTAEVTEGRGGFVTHWAPGKFDDVWYENRNTFKALSQTFAGALPSRWIVSGAWNTSGGTLNSTSAGTSDFVTTNCGCWEADFSYRARLLNQYGASGNLVGLVYNYQQLPARQNDPRPYLGLYNGDYYEVVFSPTGQAYMNKVINGVRYRVATAAHNVPRNVWFNVEVLRQSEAGLSLGFGAAKLSFDTTVKVNGVTVFDRVPQTELSYGDVGVITHWAKGRFDNLSVTDAPRRPQ